MSNGVDYTSIKSRMDNTTVSGASPIQSNDLKTQQPTSASTNESRTSNTPASVDIHQSPISVQSIRRFKPPLTESECDLQPILPQRLAELLTTNPASVLVIDIRPFTMYSFTHIQSAISICIPSTLLKRQTFGFSRIMDFVAPQDVERLKNMSAVQNIVFYDQFTNQCEAGSSLRRTAAKFIGADSNFSKRLFWVVGGLVAAAREIPSLVEAGDDLRSAASGLGTDGLDVNTDHITDDNSISPDLCGTTEPTSHSQNTQVAQDSTDITPKLTLSSVRAAPRSPFSLVPVITGMDSTLGSPMVTPSRGQPPLDDSSKISVEECVASRLIDFPRWLVGAVRRTEEGQNVLAEAFQRLQAAEIQRISSGPNRDQGSRLLSPRMRLVSPRTPATPFSDTSAVGELGISTPGSFSGSSKKEYSRLQRQQQQQLQQKSQRSLEAGNEDPLQQPDHQHQFMIVAGDDPRKNRYTNIAPFGYNRVIVRGTDYLNASYVRSTISRFQYIATQAPVPASFGDFWWCCWEQKVPVIVMLTTLRTESGQVKGNKYWFDSEYQGLKVKILKESFQDIGETNDGVIIRRIQLNLKGEIHDLTHIQYENWPDLGCPTDPKEVLELIEIKQRYLSEADETESVSVIVHCSAGCGRTGTFCAIDSVIDYLARLTWDQAQNDTVDRVQEIVHEFRKQRIAMVQNQKQLLLCYQSVMLWYLRQLESCLRQQPVKSEIIKGRKLSN